MSTKKITERDYIKANRRASREAEIENHSHPISLSRVHKSKKVYDRKHQKADDKRHLPSFFSLNSKPINNVGESQNNSICAALCDSAFRSMICSGEILRLSNSGSNDGLAESVLIFG